MRVKVGVVDYNNRDLGRKEGSDGGGGGGGGGGLWASTGQTMRWEYFFLFEKKRKRNVKVSYA